MVSKIKNNSLTLGIKGWIHIDYRVYDQRRKERHHMKKHIVFLLFIMLLAVPVHVFAGVVEPDEDGYDRGNIQSELYDHHYVKLQAGKTYYLSSYLRLDSYYTIDATGAKIVVSGAATKNSRYTKDYASMTNIRIKGGTWVSDKATGNSGTTFSFAHCRNIVLENMDIRTTNAESHAIELVACQGVTIRNCKVIAQGTGKKKSVEEMIQIDLAAPATAPFLASEYQNGLACKNITITGCTVIGNRGICANFANRNKKFLNKYHQNIVITNNHITGNTAEALALFNTINAKVTGNTIITKSKRLKDSYSIGCHLAMFGKAKKVFKKGKITVNNNTIKGGKAGFQIASHTKTKYGKVIVKNNKIYCKKGKKNALKVYSAKKKTVKKNKLKKWK